MDQPKHPKKKNKLNSYAKFSGIAFQMIAIILLGAFVGVKMDQHFPNEQDIWTISITFVAVIVSVVTVIRSINSATNNKKE